MQNNQYANRSIASGRPRKSNRRPRLKRALIVVSVALLVGAFMTPTRGGAIGWSIETMYLSGFGNFDPPLGCGTPGSFELGGVAYGAGDPGATTIPTVGSHIIAGYVSGSGTYSGDLIFGSISLSVTFTRLNLSNETLSQSEETFGITLDLLGGVSARTLPNGGPNWYGALELTPVAAGICSPNTIGPNIDTVQIEGTFQQNGGPTF